MVDAITFNELHQKIDRAAEKRYGKNKAWVNEVFLHKQEAVLQLENDRLLRVKYDFNPAGEVVIGTSEEVNRKVTFERI